MRMSPMRITHDPNSDILYLNILTSMDYCL
jgi:uncharacterized protein YuzE